MQLTTQTIIKTLPFDEEFKKTLLENLESYDVDTKFEITQLLWDTYFALYDLALEANLEDGLDAVGEGNGKLSPKFFQQIREKTDSQMGDELVETTEKVDLTSTRQKLEEMMKGGQNEAQNQESNSTPPPEADSIEENLQTSN